MSATLVSRVGSSTTWTITGFTGCQTTIPL